jgi:hypothetical protein
LTQALDLGVRRFQRELVDHVLIVINSNRCVGCLVRIDTNHRHNNAFLVDGEPEWALLIRVDSVLASFEPHPSKDTGWPTAR